MTAPKKTKPAPKKAPTIIEATEDPLIWRPWFRDRATWAPWFAFLKSVFALPLDEAELATFAACTGREAPRSEGYTEATLVIGRRGGKSLALALIAGYLACFRDWSPTLCPANAAISRSLRPTASRPAPFPLSEGAPLHPAARGPHRTRDARDDRPHEQDNDRGSDGLVQNGARPNHRGQLERRDCLLANR